MGHKSHECPDEGQDASVPTDNNAASGGGGWTSSGGDAGAWGDTSGAGAGAWDSVQTAAVVPKNEWDSSAKNDTQQASDNPWGGAKVEAASGDAWSNVQPAT